MIRQGLVPGVEGVTLHIPAHPASSPPVIHAVPNPVIPGLTTPIWPGNPQQLAEQAAHVAATQAVMAGHHENLQAIRAQRAQAQAAQAQAAPTGSGSAPAASETTPQRKYFCHFFH